MDILAIIAQVSHKDIDGEETDGYTIVVDGEAK